MGREVFISYAQADRDIAEKICTSLEKGGVQCWIAPRNIPPGFKFAEAIVHGIEECQILLLLLSENANRSNWVHKEVERAISYDRRIITVRLANLLPGKQIELFVAGDQLFDAFDRELQEFLPELVDCLRMHSSAQLRAAQERFAKDATADVRHGSGKSNSNERRPPEPDSDAAGIESSVIRAPADQDPQIKSGPFRRLNGTSAGAHRRVREMDLVVEGDEIKIHIHNPGGNQMKMWVFHNILQDVLDQWRPSEGEFKHIEVPARTSRKAAPITFRIHSSGEVEVRAGWWIRVSGAELKLSLQELGVRVPW